MTKQELLDKTKPSRAERFDIPMCAMAFAASLWLRLDGRPPRAPLAFVWLFGGLLVILIALTLWRRSLRRQVEALPDDES